MKGTKVIWLAEVSAALSVMAFSLLRVAWHIPFGPVLFFIFSTIWAMLYVLAALFRFGYPAAQLRANQYISGMFSGVAIALWILALLYDSLQLPAAAFVLPLCLILLMLFSINALSGLIRHRNVFARDLFIRLLVYTTAGMVLYALPRTFSLELFYSDRPEYIKAVKHVQENPEDTAGIRQLNEEMLRSDGYSR